MRRRTNALEEQNFKKKFWFATPKLFTFFLLFLSIIPVSLTGYAGIRPCIILIPVFYWGIFRPQSFSVSAAFFLGLFLDFSDNTPLGVNALIVAFFYMFLDSQRRFLSSKPFVFVWTGFALFSFLFYFLKWFCTAVCYSRFSPFHLFFFSWLLLVLLYPFIAWFCTLIHLFLTEKEDD